RTGCKIAVVDETGKVLDTTVVYPTPPQNKTEEAAKKLTALIKKHNVTTISIGNGTASKESEIFVADLIKQLDFPVSYMVVSEAGASVYSASKLAAEEFPQFDVSLRSAVSIARRLQDPLAELVKIDPKAIGVGQYQHDMPKNRLDTALGGVVEDCVNSVGVDVNTASFSLLSYVAGIGAALAKNIVAYREENGHFTSRKALLKVPKLGKKAFEQSAGFLRVAESKNPLDNTAVHPESYDAAEKLLELCEFSSADLKKPERLVTLPQVIAEKGEKAVADAVGIGVPTLRDMVQELLKPGRDPRDELPPPMLRSELLDISDLKPDMVLEGTVRNVVDFGAFVDIGVHQDGLVHISRICDRFLKHPSEAVRVGDVVKVKVLEVDVKRKRISLTMRDI
ncbi:MAG: helix-hairpin-helix domain-containing protein, partial [Oscillospiraceae bacterium]|nr:helix-hairpin-helix domain-containing protein [Oscillospiraceae bacterium]